MVGRILDDLGHDEVDVLGISWGGGLAQQFALQNPRRCRRVVLVSTATGSITVPAHPRVLSKMATPRRYRDPAYAASIAANLYGGRFATSPLSPKSFSRVIRGPRPGAATRSSCLPGWAGLGWTSLPFLPLIRQPTLILAGDDDPLIPMANPKLMNRLLPHSSLHIYPDGHLGLVTHAHKLAPRIAEFLRREDG